MSKQDFQNLTKEQMEKLQILLGELQPSSVTEEISLKEPPLSELFTRDEKGKILQSKNNCLLVLNHDPLFAGKIKYNEFSDKLDICGDFPWKRYSITYCDNDLRHIILYLESEYGLKKDGDIATAINIAAYDNSYNPIKEKLLSLKWDGISRLPDALHHFLGAAKNRLNTEILKVFMLGAIVRIFDPGHKFEYMPVLVGGQGAGKSTFLRLLAMEDRYFSDDIKKLDDEKIYARLQGHWINEIPEMLAVSSAKAVEETKKFLSTQSDIYRVPYETTAMDHPRQCVFAGTSNKIQFLPMDKSGNRRFLPVEVHPEDADCHILDDEKASRAYIEQLWAEVMEIYLAGDYSLVLPDDLQDELLAVQDKHSPEDPIETSIRNFLDDHSPDYVCTKMLFKEALGHIGYENPSAWECNVISEIMDHKMTDYKKISSHRFKEYGTQRAWKRVNEPVFRDIPIGMESEIPFLTKT